jgi:hypothetical protein
MTAGVVRRTHASDAGGIRESASRPSGEWNDDDYDVISVETKKAQGVPGLKDQVRV